MDISKCDGISCDRKETCYRYTAEADPIYQSYIMPINRGKRCDDYWGVETKEQTITVEKAIDYAKNANFCTGCEEPQFAENPTEICNRCKHRLFFETAIETLENCPPKDSLCYGCRDNCKECDLFKMAMS